MPSSSDDKNATERFSKSTVKQAEKLIDSSPDLRAARDISNGFKPTSGISTGANDPQYKAGYDNIKWSKDKPKATFKIRVNGKLINPDEET